jgi:hypothetical protein
MMHAKARFRCDLPEAIEPGSLFDTEYRERGLKYAESYLFLSERRADAQIVNVWYDANDVVSRSYIVDSADETAWLRCASF